MAEYQVSMRAINRHTGHPFDSFPVLVHATSYEDAFEKACSVFEAKMKTKGYELIEKGEARRVDDGIDCYTEMSNKGWGY